MELGELRLLGLQTKRCRRGRRGQAPAPLLSYLKLLLGGGDDVEAALLAPVCLVQNGPATQRAEGRGLPGPCGVARSPRGGGVGPGVRADGDPRPSPRGWASRAGPQVAECGPLPSVLRASGPDTALARPSPRHPEKGPSLVQCPASSALPAAPKDRAAGVTPPRGLRTPPAPRRTHKSPTSPAGRTPPEHGRASTGPTGQVTDRGVQDSGDLPRVTLQ